MVVGPAGDVGVLLELHYRAAKNKNGRRVPLHRDLREALVVWRNPRSTPIGRVITSERGTRMTAGSMVNCFANAFRTLGLEGCSSHSGRTFIIRAARSAHKAGASMRDVQLLAGPRSIQTTQRYIDGDTDAQRKLVSLI